MLTGGKKKKQKHTTKKPHHPKKPTTHQRERLVLEIHQLLIPEDIGLSLKI